MSIISFTFKRVHCKYHVERGGTIHHEDTIQLVNIAKKMEILSKNFLKQLFYCSGKKLYYKIGIEKTKKL